MKFKHIKTSIIFFLVLVLASCNLFEDQLSYNEIERKVRNNQDKRAIFFYSDYEQILNAINEKKCVNLPLFEMANYEDTNKVIVGIKHDIDCHPFKALELAEIENRYNIRTTYYILQTAFYYGKLKNNGKFIRYNSLDALYKKIYDLGNEVGIHNDLLTIMIDWGLEPFEFNKYTIKELNNIGITVYGTSAHGANICHIVKHINYEIFSDFAKCQKIEYQGKTYQIGINTLNEFGYSYEAYHIPYNIYISDAGGEFSISKICSDSKDVNLYSYSIDDRINYEKVQIDTKGVSIHTKNNVSITEIVETIKNAQPGDRIVILTHPVWWKQ